MCGCFGHRSITLVLAKRLQASFEEHERTVSAVGNSSFKPEVEVSSLPLSVKEKYYFEMEKLLMSSGTTVKTFVVSPGVLSET